MEAQIIKSLLTSRETFNTIEKFNLREDLSDQGQVIYDVIHEFYSTDPNATLVNTNILLQNIQRKFPRQHEIFTQIITNLPEESISGPNLVKEIIALKKLSLGRELSSQLLGTNEMNILPLMEQYMDIERQIELLADDEDLINGLELTSLFSKLEDDKKFRLWPKSLQAATGGASRGNNLLVFGRPEVGKSLFIINLVCGFLHDGHKVLFIENEDPINSTLSRIVCRLADKTIFDVAKDLKNTEEVIKSKGYDNLYLKSMSPGTFAEINGLIERHSPDVVIINQLRNLHVGKGEKVTTMERAATGARNLAKKHDILVVSVTQAGDSASNKLVLDLSDIDFSKTGMPAQMDLIVGVGSNEEFEGKARRMISLSKNKLSGKHEFFPVNIDIHLNKVTSL